MFIYISPMFTKCHFMLTYVTVCHICPPYVIYGWYIFTVYMPHLISGYHIVTLCHLYSLYITYVHHATFHWHMLVICHLHSPYVHYMSYLFTIYHIWFTYVHDISHMCIYDLCSPYTISDYGILTIFHICSFCITYARHMSSLVEMWSPCHLCSFYEVCSPYIIPGWHMFTICHPCPTHVNCGWDMFTICHSYLPYVISHFDIFPYVIPGSHMVTISHLCSLYVTFVYWISSLVVICSPFFYLCLLYNTCAHNLISVWDMFTICHKGKNICHLW